MSIPIDEVYRVTFVGRAGYGDALRLVVHYHPTVTGALTSFDDLLHSIETGAAAIFMQVVHNSAVLDKITIRTYTDPVLGGDRAVSITGGISGDPMPQQTAQQVLWYTNFIGSAYRGHNKFWYTGESKYSAGVLTSSAVTELETAADAFLTIYDFATGLIPLLQLVVLSKELQQAELVTSRVVTPDPRNQLSRTIGRGA